MAQAIWLKCWIKSWLQSVCPTFSPLLHHHASIEMILRWCATFRRGRVSAFLLETRREFTSRVFEKASSASRSFVMLTPSTFRARGLISGVLPFLPGGGSASFKTCMADDGKGKGACRVRPSPGPGSGVTAKTLAGQKLPRPTEMQCACGVCVWKGLGRVHLVCKISDTVLLVCCSCC